MEVGQRLAAALLLLLVRGSVTLQAQTTARAVTFGAAGGLATYVGPAGESGVGALARLLAEFRPTNGRLGFRTEVSVQRYTAVGQTCTTEVPGACWPASPPSRVWSAGLHTSYRVGDALGRLLLSSGLGVYGRSASASSAPKTTVGGEAGLGLALGRRRVLLEARYVRIGTGPSRATVWPVSVGMLF